MCRGHAEDILPEHFCNEATDRRPHIGFDGAGRAWLLVIATRIHDDFPDSLPDGVAEISGKRFAPSVLHPPCETQACHRRDMERITIGFPRAAHFNVVSGPCIGGIISPLYLRIIQVVRLQPQERSFAFSDLSLE